jgi:tRNA(fMet)-specific endonuclease VapC
MIFIDSDCIIDFLRGDESAVKIISKYVGEIVSSELNSFEVFFGIFNKKNISKNELIFAERFFENIEVFAFDSQCGKIAARLLTDLKKKGIEINQNDCLIASVMIKNGVDKIITRNKKHFERIKELKVLSY